MKSTLVLSFLSALSSVSAHGFIRQIAIDGKMYRGNEPKATNFDSPIRLIDDPSPVKGAMNRAVNCGPNAQPAALVAAAMPGSQITFDWSAGGDSNWPHNTGGMYTYLASTGNTTADKFDAINARWFKIDQVGRKKDGTWFQQDIMNGDTYTTQLPADLAPGDYLIRHEIIALHLATNKGGAEFYPSCSQIRVGGSGTGVPDPNTLVSLPGAYSDNDPGIFDPDVFNTAVKYVFPGPPVNSKLASGRVAITSPAPKTDGNSKAGANAQPSSQKNDMAQPSTSSSASDSASTPESGSYYLPRDVSRIMRNIVANA